MKTMLALMVVTLVSVPVLAQKKRVAKKPSPPVVAAVVQPVAPVKKRTPSMTVTAETSASAEESGKGVVLSEKPFAPDEPEHTSRRASAKTERAEQDSGSGRQSQHATGGRSFGRSVIERPVVDRPQVNKPQVVVPRVNRPLGGRH